METENLKDETNNNVKECPTLKILVVGNQGWIKKHKKFFDELKDYYKIQYLTTIAEATQRLWHNSYDLLLIEHKFCKENTIDLTTYSYARSKPSIILCQNMFVKLYYDFWKKFSGMAKICNTIRRLMFVIVYKDDHNLLFHINKIASHKYRYQNQVTNQISEYF